METIKLTSKWEIQKYELANRSLWLRQRTNEETESEKLLYARNVTM